MTDAALDAIDSAFVRRWQRATDAATCAAPASGVDPEAAAPPAIRPPSERSAPPPATSGSLVERLLHAAWPEWQGLAAHVEAARLRGRRVLAVAGGEPREGRTTLVACLASVLRSRGGDVHCATAQALRSAAASPTGRCHDKQIVLVDAGIWFPPGPIHRQWLTRCVVGSDAAILVRRADRRSVAARHSVLESLGIEVLGEVLTFTDDGLAAEPAA